MCVYIHAHSFAISSMFKQRKQTRNIDICVEHCEHVLHARMLYVVSVLHVFNTIEYELFVREISVRAYVKFRSKRNHADMLAVKNMHTHTFIAYACYTCRYLFGTLFFYYRKHNMAQM